jgi:hypothetical protein
MPDAYMGFLYLRGRARLENLYMRWHLSAKCRGRAHAPAAPTSIGVPMLDILMLALGFGLFALAIGYTYACERL